MTSRNMIEAISLIALLGVSRAVIFVQAASTRSAEYVPSWSIGAKWKVEVVRMTEPPSLPKEMLEKFKPKQVTFVFEFAVEALVDIDAEKCYRVRIDQRTLDGKPLATPVEFWRLYVRQTNLTLRKVERLTIKPEKVEASREFESGPVDATDWVGFLPLAFPSFDAEQAGQDPPVRLSKKGKIEFKPSGRCRQTEEITRISADGKETDALKMTLERECDDGHSRCTTETWIKGKPWWVEAAHNRDGHLWCSARLLKD